MRHAHEVDLDLADLSADASVLAGLDVVGLEIAELPFGTEGERPDVEPLLDALAPLLDLRR